MHFKSACVRFGLSGAKIQHKFEFRFVLPSKSASKEPQRAVFADVLFFSYLCTQIVMLMKRMRILGLMLLLGLLQGVKAEEVQYLTTAEFKAKVFDYTASKTWQYKGKKPCIIDFYTTWCGPCKRLAPIMEEIAEEYCDQIVIYKVDTERERELAQYFGIHSIPTILFCPVRGNPQVAQGLLPKETLRQAVEQVLLPK